MDSGSHKSRKTREHFICFTSRLSMKISSSKSSIVSPGRSRDPPNNKLPSSLSRRLRASPMFPTTGGRKRGTGFENPEPSSPKVTCIGQVRVKTKKQGKKMCSRRLTKECSFGTDENQNKNNNIHMIQRQGSVNHSFHHQQQDCSSHRWVHLPLTICETLRSFGAGVSCFLFPCNKSSCFSGKRERGSSCVGVFARWLVAVEEQGGGGEEEAVRSIRRHVFDGIEIREEGVSEGRASVCVPPKNALLLMRCRSDPVKMEALANRFWEPQFDKEDEEDEENDEAVVVEMIGDKNEILEKHRVSIDERRRISVSVAADNAEKEELEKCTEAGNESRVVGQENEEPKEFVKDLEINDQDNEEANRRVLVEEEKELSFVTALEALVDQETESEEEEDENDEGSRTSFSFNSFTPHSESDETCKPDHQEDVDLVQEFDANETSNVVEEEEAKDQILQVEMMEKVTAVKEEESAVKIVEEKERKSVEIMDKQNGLPDCLLLMMCEPKLSMEVSKETWVCSTDFIRYQPKPPVKAKEADEKRRLSVDSASASGNPFAALLPPHRAAQPQQPPRSLCSSTAAMATMIEQKLVNAVAYEPFVLTRCKSEPVNTAAKVAAWKNGGLEPHRRSTVGVSAAGF